MKLSTVALSLALLCGSARSEQAPENRHGQVVVTIEPEVTVLFVTQKQQPQDLVVSDYNHEQDFWDVMQLTPSGTRRWQDIPQEEVEQSNFVLSHPDNVAKVLRDNGVVVGFISCTNTNNPEILNKLFSTDFIGDCSKADKAIDQFTRGLTEITTNREASLLKARTLAKEIVGYIQNDKKAFISGFCTLQPENEALLLAAVKESLRAQGATTLLLCHRGAVAPADKIHYAQLGFALSSLSMDTDDEDEDNDMDDETYFSTSLLATPVVRDYNPATDWEAAKACYTSSIKEFACYTDETHLARIRANLCFPQVTTKVLWRDNKIVALLSFQVIPLDNDKIAMADFTCWEDDLIGSEHFARLFGALATAARQQGASKIQVEAYKNKEIFKELGFTAKEEKSPYGFACPTMQYIL